ncbi:hypothetical protein FR943_03545 [Mycobacterium sp. TNTM28]|uniref:PE-PPE domain-containing protein n=1 Tax=[Mycobacterium] fortunisiensis TaxID=2600579 RepID=A0ABS6KH86_9MYCO|nr:hypothetical protein [[Mycobacterium] fortunisiensis]MBU9762928.1 hypothetical protein [[Mycobacterium] fortunisiensis]
MNSRVSSGLTACVALASAGVIAITPVASPPTPPRVVEASAQLMADFSGMNQAELVAEFGKRLTEQAIQAPLLPLVLAAQLAANDGNRRLQLQLRQIVDAPVYVADPLIEAIAITLPEQFGGGSDHVTNTTDDGAFMQFRNNELLGLRDGINAQIADLLGVTNPLPDQNYNWDLVQGLMESSANIASLAVRAPLGLIPIAQAIAEGNNAALYSAIRAYIDGPQWAIDPAIEGLARALPESLGGGTDGNFRGDNGEDGALMKFRNNQLIGARDNAHHVVAGALGVELDSQDNPVEPDTDNADVQRSTLQAAAPEVGSQNTPETRQQKPKLNVANLKPHVTSVTNVGTSLDDGKARAEKRRDRARANLDRVVNKAKAAADNTSKKLGLKKKSNSDD